MPEQAVSPPSPVPQEKPRVPELVTDSLVSALDSVAVPKPQALTLPQKTEPVPAPAPPTSPARPSPAVEMDIQPIQAPPQPLKLAQGPVPGKSETPTPAPKVDPLAKKLKQAVDTIVVPRKPKQHSRRVGPTVTPVEVQKPDLTRTPPPSDITMPSRAPRLAAVAPPEAPKKEKPLEPARKNSTVESFKTALQSVQVPAKIQKSKAPQPESKTVKPRKRSQVVVPAAPQLAKVHVEPDPNPAEPEATSEGLQDSDVLPGFQETESGTQDTLPLQVAGSSPKGNVYWAKVQALIARKWLVYRVKFQRPLQVVLAFRVARDGRVTKLKVVKSSGNGFFDRTAKRAVVAADPLPPFSANMSNPFYEVQYTFTGPRN